jgi:hypothetical protein
MCVQSDKSPNFGKLRDSEEKRHLGVAHVVSHKECYKGEAGGFPQV